jgi:hypothetical protein
MPGFGQKAFDLLFIAIARVISANCDFHKVIPFAVVSNINMHVFVPRN